MVDGISSGSTSPPQTEPLSAKENVEQLFAVGDVGAALMYNFLARSNEVKRMIKQEAMEYADITDQIKYLNDMLAEYQEKLGNAETEVQKAGYQRTTTELKGQIDKLNSDATLKNIRIQSLNNTSTAGDEAASNVLAKWGKTLEAIVGNLR